MPGPDKAFYEKRKMDALLRAVELVVRYGPATTSELAGRSNRNMIRLGQQLMEAKRQGMIRRSADRWCTLDANVEPRFTSWTYKTRDGFPPVASVWDLGRAA